MMYESILLVFLMCVVITYFILKHRRRFSSSIKTFKDLPGPKTWPLIGSAPFLLMKCLKEGNYYIAILHSSFYTYV